MQAVHPTYRHQLISIESAERLTRVERVRDARQAEYRQRPVRVESYGRRLILALGAVVLLPGVVIFLG